METIKLKNGKIRFRAKIYLPNGLSRSKCFARKTDADRWVHVERSMIKRNEALGITPLKENLKFEAFASVWMNQKIRPIRSFKTTADYDGIIRKHFANLFGSISLQSFERGHADRLVRVLQEKKLAAKTINKVVAVFKQIFLFAEIEGYLNKSPFRNFEKLKTMAGRIDYLSNQEIVQLLRSTATTEIYPILVVALNTGLRVGELLGLCFDRINFDSQTIEISRNLTRKGLQNVTKTHLIRHIPMNSEVQSIMTQLVREQRNPKFLFVRKNGEPYNPDHFSSRELLPALERSGIRRITFHILRHTYASQFMMNGGNAYDLQKILGHTKFEMTQKYAHLSPQHLRKAVDTVRFSSEGNKSIIPFSAHEQNSNGLRVVASS